MSAAADLIKRIDALDRADRQEVFDHLTRPVEPAAFPGIKKTAGVCGGVACVRDFRLPVWGLESYRRHGLSDARLLELYPFLTADDLAHTWAYVAGNRTEVDRDIARNEGE